MNSFRYVSMLEVEKLVERTARHTQQHAITGQRVFFQNFKMVNSPFNSNHAILDVMSQPGTPSDANAQEQATPSISAAAQAYQIAMQQQSATPPSAPDPDVEMADSKPEPAVSPAKIYLWVLY
jgi:hypothetical protein